MKYIATMVDQKHTFEELKRKAIDYDVDPPIIRYDKTALEVGLDGDFTFGGKVTETIHKNLKVRIRCISNEDSFVELQFGLKGQLPVQVMLKRTCSIPTTSAKSFGMFSNDSSSDGYLSTLIKLIIRAFVALIRVMLILTLVIGVAVIIDKFCLNRLFTTPPISRPITKGGLAKKEDLVELKPLMQMRAHYGTLNS